MVFHGTHLATSVAGYFNGLRRLLPNLDMLILDNVASLDVEPARERVIVDPLHLPTPPLSFQLPCFRREAGTSMVRLVVTRWELVDPVEDSVVT